MIVILPTEIMVHTIAVVSQTETLNLTTGGGYMATMAVINVKAEQMAEIQKMEELSAQILHRTERVHPPMATQAEEAGRYTTIHRLSNPRLLIEEAVEVMKGQDNLHQLLNQGLKEALPHTTRKVTEDLNVRPTTAVREMKGVEVRRQPRVRNVAAPSQEAVHKVMSAPRKAAQEETIDHQAEVAVGPDKF